MSVRADRTAVRHGPGRATGYDHRAAARGSRTGRRLTLDFAAGDAVFIPGLRRRPGVFFVMSDLLGDNLLFGSLASFQGRHLGSIFANINATAVYLNQPTRQLGIRGLPDQGPELRGRAVVCVRRDGYGVVGCCATRSAASPASKARRSSSIRTGWTSLCRGQPRRVGWIASHYMSYVQDNSLWLPAARSTAGVSALPPGSPATSPTAGSTAIS